MRRVDSFLVATRYSTERLLMDNSCAASSWLTSSLSFGFTVTDAGAFFLGAISIAINIPHPRLRAKTRLRIFQRRRTGVPPQETSVEIPGGISRNRRVLIGLCVGRANATHGERN